VAQSSEFNSNISLIRQSKKERLIALIFIGILIFNYPILSLFSSSFLIFGIPLLYFYIFSIWLIFIFLIAWTVNRKNSNSKGD